MGIFFSWVGAKTALVFDYNYNNRYTYMYTISDFVTIFPTLCDVPAPS